jgi:iron complex transport system substrate-binding protein
VTTRVRARAIASVVLAVFVAGCDTERSGPGLDGGPARSDAASTDARLVVMAPAAAEMLERLGLLDRVVAIGEYGPWPKSLRDLPVAGGYANPNIELVLDLRADTLITAESQAAGDAHRRLESLGVRVMALDTSTHEGVFRSLEELGSAFHREERAAEIVATLESELRTIEAEAADLPRRRVLFVVGRDPTFVAGPGSHIDRMIAEVGGLNVAGKLLAPYAQMSMEAVLEEMPEIIIDTSDNRPEAPLGRIVGSWSRWPSIPAVRDGRVYRVHPSRLVIPGVRLPEMTRRMGRLIHPEQFGEPDPADYLPLESEDGGPAS